MPSEDFNKNRSSHILYSSATPTPSSRLPFTQCRSLVSCRHLPYLRSSFRCQFTYPPPLVHNYSEKREIICFSWSFSCALCSSSSPHLATKSITQIERVFLPLYDLKVVERRCGSRSPSIEPGSILYIFSVLEDDVSPIGNFTLKFHTSIYTFLLPSHPIPIKILESRLFHGFFILFFFSLSRQKTTDNGSCNAGNFPETGFSRPRHRANIIIIIIIVTSDLLDLVRRFVLLRRIF